MDEDLELLEQKLALLVARSDALCEANDTLRRELASAKERNRALAQRMQAASTRLDALIERMPETEGER
jgi:chromosome segregation ATPase